MPSLLQQYFNSSSFVTIGSIIYNIKENGKCHGSIGLKGKRMNLVEGEKLSRLEELMLNRKQGNNCPKFINQIGTYARLIGIRAPENGYKPIVESILPKDFFNHKGRIFHLEKGKGNIKVRMKSYRIGSYFKSIDDIIPIHDYYIRNSIQGNAGNSLKKLIGRKVDYQLSNNLGFETIGESFYLFTAVPPYILYEKLNSSYYQFPAARVATRLISYNSKVKCDPLIVMEPYTHPSLGYTNKPFQKICTGNFKYDDIMKKNKSTEEQLLALMHYARKVLTECYFSSGNPYNLLTHSKYSHMKVRGRADRGMVTNV
ncbi:MAG: hypothetical protein ABIB71_07055 [Candidatus Woesearchaeota archaeon]